MDNCGFRTVKAHGYYVVRDMHIESAVAIFPHCNWSVEEDCFAIEIADHLETAMRDDNGVEAFQSLVVQE